MQSKRERERVKRRKGKETKERSGLFLHVLSKLWTHFLLLLYQQQTRLRSPCSLISLKSARRRSQKARPLQRYSEEEGV